MYIGLGRFDFLVEGSKSLKDKRRAVKSLVEGMRSRFNVSVAEIDHADLRQRGAIGVSCVSNSSFMTKKMLNEIERAVRGTTGIEVIDSATKLVTPDD